MIKQLLNLVIAKYRDLSMSRRSIICLSLRLRQIIDLLVTDKSRYFGQPCPIIVNNCTIVKHYFSTKDKDKVFMHWELTLVNKEINKIIDQRLLPAH